MFGLGKKKGWAGVKNELKLIHNNGIYEEGAAAKEMRRRKGKANEKNH